MLEMVKEEEECDGLWWPVAAYNGLQLHMKIGNNSWWKKKNKREKMKKKEREKKKKKKNWIREQSSDGG